jgi:hypothetical protein
MKTRKEKKKKRRKEEKRKERKSPTHIYDRKWKSP